MPSRTFVMRPALVSDIATGPQVSAVLRARGQRVLSAATAAAPISTGRYQQSLHLVVGRDGDRVKARVGSTDPGAVVIEQRTATLSRALGAARG